MSKTILLERFCEIPDGTFGRLYVGNEAFVTVERPWINNTPWISCIPCGEYSVEECMYNKGGYPAYEIKGVVGRTNIKIHRGNLPTDTMGCVAIGEKLGGVYGKWGILRSAVAHRKFMEEARRVGANKIVIMSK